MPSSVVTTQASKAVKFLWGGNVRMVPWPGANDTEFANALSVKFPPSLMSIVTLWLTTPTLRTLQKKAPMLVSSSCRNPVEIHGETGVT